MADKLYNKIIFDGKTLIDLTNDSVTADMLLVGSTAHDKTGAIINGACTYDSDTTDATALAGEILNGKTAYIGKQKVEGTMPNRGGVTGTISSKAEEYTIANGYHDGSGKVSIAEAEQEKLVAENIRQGITILGVEGTMTGTEDVNAESKNVTPTTSEQIIVPDTEVGYNYIAQVTVAAIPYAETENDAGGLTVTIA